MKNRIRGFTLTELLIVLILAGVVVTQAVPFFMDLMERSHRQAEISHLISLFNLSRSKALSEGQPVTICAMGPNRKCSKNWRLPITAFKDPDRTRTVTDELQIIRVFEPGTAGYFTANSGIRDHFRYRPSGMALDAIGNIIWCPNSGDPKRAMQLRINMGGRVQVARDTDSDGIAEDASGQPIGCPHPPA